MTLPTGIAIFIEGLSLAAYVRGLAILAVAGLAALFLLVWFPQWDVQVNGSVYRTIVVKKDLLGDTLPPPLIRSTR